MVRAIVCEFIYSTSRFEREDGRRDRCRKATRKRQARVVGLSRLMFRGYSGLGAKAMWAIRTIDDMFVDAKDGRTGK